MLEAPTFKIKTMNINSEKDFIIVDKDAFHTHVIDFISTRLIDDYDNNKHANKILCYFKPEQPIANADKKYQVLEAVLEPKGYQKSLQTCLSHFEALEDYEKCAYIKELIKKI